MSAECADRMAELDHCHGTLVEHHDGSVDCTDDGCADLAMLRHELVISCAELAGGCGCADAAPMPLAAVA